MADSLHERGQAVENLFFAERDQKLLEKLKTELAAEETRAALASATGIRDQAVLDSLIEQKISLESMTVVSLVPLVAIAWADGSVHESEHEAIMGAAESAGVQKGSAAAELLDSWLSEKPGEDLLASWKAYVVALKSTLDPEAAGQLKSRVMERAEKVAAAAGGFLGLGNKISDAEQKVLEDLESTFA